MLIATITIMIIRMLCAPTRTSQGHSLPYLHANNTALALHGNIYAGARTDQVSIALFAMKISVSTFLQHGYFKGEMSIGIQRARQRINCEEALLHRPVGRRFESRSGDWIFSN